MKRAQLSQLNRDSDLLDDKDILEMQAAQSILESWWPGEQAKAGAVAATRKPFIEQIDRLEGLMNNYSVDDIETDAFRQWPQQEMSMR